MRRRGRRKVLLPWSIDCHGQSRETKSLSLCSRGGGESYSNMLQSFRACGNKHFLDYCITIRQKQWRPWSRFNGYFLNTRSIRSVIIADVSKRSKLLSLTRSCVAAAGIPSSTKTLVTLPQRKCPGPVSPSFWNGPWPSLLFHCLTSDKKRFLWEYNVSFN